MLEEEFTNYVLRLQHVRIRNRGARGVKTSIF